jgi:hypothetical protein
LGVTGLIKSPSLISSFILKDARDPVLVGDDEGFGMLDRGNEVSFTGFTSPTQCPATHDYPADYSRPR